MSTTRLTFLYPHLFRAPRLGESASQATQLARRSAARKTAQVGRRIRGARFASATSPKQSTFVARHGKAVEPMPLSGSGDSTVSTSGPRGETGRIGRHRRAAPKPGPPSASEKSSNGGTTRYQAVGAGPAAAETAAASGLPPVIELGAPVQPPPQQPDQASADSSAKKHANGPMDAILHMGGAPESIKKPPPHLTTPPYLHHFDTYSLVKRLESGGYTQEQSITAMKAVRALLAQNLDVAQEGLVSRRDVDNETYLFRAACSELSTEVKNNRRIADEHMRQQRTHIQHEADIANQSLNQELLTLNDSVKGMFNDRRMAVREEQKAAESVIQQIHYKMSVKLTSDAKSDIEGLRWVLIRRGILGLIFMGLISVGSIRYGSYINHDKQKRARKRAEDAETRRRNDGKMDHSSAPDAAGILAAN
ncbi:hypothetical protein GGTG_01402 [Gaeumannomyces tritici R3-111a-1]|uniref:MOZ protein represents a chromatin-associated acetyltransferase n=1 Tax=Gaeumannomyces tritici (strain R3-111a-1) TaxID=644352 RepID=J3NJH0_GAET3|nr:hypothetical protein GGTG_01402 [Gaeumannomyces tritici R3-111a-1]EJT81422.1 hypothetical protein GGTG_01402 [Gaeumannomyces tritici R3-111a-1]